MDNVVALLCGLGIMYLFTEWRQYKREKRVYEEYKARAEEEVEGLSLEDLVARNNARRRARERRGSGG